MENEYLNAISDELREIVEAFNELPTITDDSIKNGLLGLVKDLAEIDMRVEKDKDVLDKMKEENASLQSQGLSNLWQNTNQFYDAYDAKTATSTAKPALKNELEAVRKKLGKKVKTEEDKEDEEIVTDVRHSGLDPITKKQIQNPVQHKVCKHAYDKDSIMEYIEQQKTLRAKQNRQANNPNTQTATNKPITCPYIGCSRLLAEDQLQDFPNFFTQCK